MQQGLPRTQANIDFGLTLPLNLHVVPPSRHAEATAALEARDIDGFLFTTSGNAELLLVIDNVMRLQCMGLYETALAQAFTSAKLNNRRIGERLLRQLFALADRGRLRDAGDPLPSAGPFTLYRGVAGVGQDRRERGLSWTDSRDKAQWFADRSATMLKLEDPAVFTCRVKEQHVYYYTNERKEREFVINLPAATRLHRV